jgi:hypothetical protein
MNMFPETGFNPLHLLLTQQTGPEDDARLNNGQKNPEKAMRGARHRNYRAQTSLERA